MNASWATSSQRASSCSMRQTNARDPRVIAAVELLEGRVVAVPDGGDEVGSREPRYLLWRSNKHPCGVSYVEMTYPERRHSKYRPAQMAHLKDLIAYLDELLVTRRLRRLRAQRASGAGIGQGRRCRHGRLGPPGALRGSRGRRRRAGRRPPRPVLGLPPARADARDEGAAAPPVRPRHRAGRLPPAARRASRGGQQRADLRGARARAGRAVRGAPRPERGLRRALRRGHPVRRPARALRRGVRAGAVRVGHGSRAGATASASSREARPRASARRSRWASTPSSRASRRST